MHYRLIIFDMDGTILDTLTDLCTSVNYALEKNGFPQKTLDEIRWLLGRGVQKLVRDALPQNSEGDFDKVFADFMAHYSVHSADKTCAYDGIIELLQELKKSGYKLAVNSNKPDKEANFLAEKYFPGMFDFVLGSRPELEKKPSPDGVHFIIKHFGIESEKSVYIGDSDVDLQTGLNSGVDFIGAGWGFRGKDFLLEHGAKTVVMTPKEILNLL